MKFSIDLVDGSVVRIKVIAFLLLKMMCRTKGPFHCPAGFFCLPAAIDFVMALVLRSENWVVSQFEFTQRPLGLQS